MLRGIGTMNWWCIGIFLGAACVAMVVLRVLLKEDAGYPPEDPMTK